jgi:ribonuclease HI
MVQTRKQSAKVREGLTSHLPHSRSASKLSFKPPLISANAPRNHKLREQLGELKGRRRLRARRLRDLILGPGRTFSGKIFIPNSIDARDTDSARLNDIAAARLLGHAIVYWADGAYGVQGAQEGFMGAGVVWQDEKNIYSMHYKLGRRTGNNEDAEVFAIAAALGRATKEVKRSKDIRLVRIITDAMNVLEKLARGIQWRFGPMLAKRTALQGLYERTEWLTAQGVSVELVWAKGHSKSEGNRFADRAAHRAVKEQAQVIEPYTGDDKSTRAMTEADVPEMWKELGPDWADEWLSRANEHLYTQEPKNGSEWLDIQERDWPTRDRPLGDNDDVPDSEPSSDNYLSNLQRGFVLPMRNKYGNVTTEQVIEDLYKKRDLIDSQITELERHIARHATKNQMRPKREELLGLDRERICVDIELQAQIEEQRYTRVKSLADDDDDDLTVNFDRHLEMQHHTQADVALLL